MLDKSKGLPAASDCRKGRVYRLVCRNLSYGVYDGDDGFIGVREKFGNLFLFTEYHWDTENHHPFGTVRDAVDTGLDYEGALNEDNPELFRFLERVGHDPTDEDKTGLGG